MEPNISYAPSDGLCYDPSEPKYWDSEGMLKEVERTFEICHGCRMCFKYCDSFPSLFRFIDENHDGDVRKLTETETGQVMDECFQCKLCEVQCPYTERDNHEFKLDFPKLVHRYKAIRHKEKGASLRDKVLGDPDKAGKMARILPVMVANTANRNKIHRYFFEKVVGVHRDKLLPDFAGETFEKWAEKNGKIADDGEVVLFQTCYVQNNEPEIGRDTVEVLEKNQVKTACAKGLNCCGMPAWEHGDIDGLRKMARDNIEKLLPFVEKGAKVLAINPTCAMMLRREYPSLVDIADRAKAEKIAAATMDPGEYLWSIRNEERFCAEAKSKPESVAYHAPCHLRAQAVGFKGRDLIRKVLGVAPSTTMECCGHDGTYAMTVEGFEPSQRIGKKAFDGMQTDPAAEVWATDCPLAAIQFEQHAGKKPMHPMSILAKAYRGEEF